MMVMHDNVTMARMVPDYQPPTIGHHTGHHSAQPQHDHIQPLHYTSPTPLLPQHYTTPHNSIPIGSPSSCLTPLHRRIIWGTSDIPPHRPPPHGQHLYSTPPRAKRGCSILWTHIPVHHGANDITKLHQVLHLPTQQWGQGF